MNERKKAYLHRKYADMPVIQIGSGTSPVSPRGTSASMESNGSLFYAGNHYSKYSHENQQEKQKTSA